MTELTPDEIIDGFIMTGIHSKSLPPGYELPEKARHVLKNMIRVLSPVMVNNTAALTTLGMGFIEGYRHGSGEKVIGEVGWGLWK